jgi:hypothetical protein
MISHTVGDQKQPSRGEWAGPTAVVQASCLDQINNKVDKDGNRNAERRRQPPQRPPPLPQWCGERFGASSAWPHLPRLSPLPDGLLWPVPPRRRLTQFRSCKAQQKTSLQQRMRQKRTLRSLELRPSSRASLARANEHSTVEEQVRLDMDQGS